MGRPRNATKGTRNAHPGRELYGRRIFGAGWTHSGPNKRQARRQERRSVTPQVIQEELKVWRDPDAEQDMGKGHRG